MCAGLNSVADAEGLHTSCCFALVYTAKTQRAPHIFEAHGYRATALGESEICVWGQVVLCPAFCH